MKKIISPAHRELAEYYCDRHPDRICQNEIKTMCWYGSDFDLMNLEMHLCNECMEEFYDYIKNNFGVEPKEASMI
jgi:hypothetical protein